ncbi:glycoside hydrolase family 99-like domain-containing protein [Salinimicrobium sp. TIG7-5_MAKvit]|uniref:glycosyltransferase WbsX family protein n=1 Tax=Salinimicrobium sp. TIG7-5_MAKvit TaxID=3121289 RepID=UPI003C6E1E59
MSNRKIEFLAYYLPQYHPIPENDKWWGKGFTEWTNVVKAKPLFKGHEQPKLPSNLGFYDLRLAEARAAQAKLAKENGIDGFIYYQYWFGNGKMLLERPAEEMLRDREPDFPFCFCWANETWKGIWHGVDNPEVLIEQTYNGENGYRQYFTYLLPFFKDSRYIKVDSKPMFHIYRVEDIPDFDNFSKIFNEEARKNGFKGIYIISTIVADVEKIVARDDIDGQVGLDIFHRMRYNQDLLFPKNKFFTKLERKIKKKIGHTNKIGERQKPLIFDYKKGVSKLNVEFPHKKYISCVFPNWDNSPRSGKKSLIFKNSNPNAWQEHLQVAVDELVKNPRNPPFVFIKSWNEWAEGNYLEPDTRYGMQWLEAVANVKKKLEEQKNQ